MRVLAFPVPMTAALALVMVPDRVYDRLEIGDTPQDIHALRTWIADVANRLHRQITVYGDPD